MSPPGRIPSFGAAAFGADDESPGAEGRGPEHAVTAAATPRIVSTQRIRVSFMKISLRSVRGRTLEVNPRIEHVTNDYLVSVIQRS